ncbi:MAG: primosomal protein N' [Gemmataceae bacterium]
MSLRPSLPAGFLFDEGQPARVYARVVFNRPVDRAFIYAIPEGLQARVVPGVRVEAPFGRDDRLLVGTCVAVTAEPPQRPVKWLHRVLTGPLVTPALIELARWMADYYLCPWGQILEAMIPAGAKHRTGLREQAVYEAVPDGERPAAVIHLTPAQERALAVLRQAAQPLIGSDWAQRAACSDAVLRGLVRKGLVRCVRGTVETHPLEPTTTAGPCPIALTTEQERAVRQILAALEQGRFRPFLLFGVTGSGKTEVYLRAIERVLSAGRQAIVLVPEISLTPQTVERFRSRLGRVAVLHSHLSEAERGASWRRIAAGEIPVVVGPRSALFAPTPRLGLIVVDEEHEPSYKQEQSPRYHARDVAIKRAQLEQVPVVLGSATPSAESWHRARSGRYTLLTLPRRVLDRPLPRVALVDMRYRSGPKPGAISAPLEQAMREALAAGGQVLLLLNRRGYATFLLCPGCGEVVRCRFCEVPLTHHRERQVAMCHYCGYEQEPPQRCARCGLPQIRYLGIGTQKLEAELAHKFPGIPAQRMDSDAMRRRGSYSRTLEAFRTGDIRILFGTQMIAKGLDFPQVTLVGVINADLALVHPDFRSSERTFQLLTQVAGRTGRGSQGGRVLVQTFNPELPCIALAARHDYVTFMEKELQHRRLYQYPPFSRLVRIVVRSKDREQAAQSAQRMADALRDAGACCEWPAVANDTETCNDQADSRPVRLLGPAEAPLARLKGYYRFHMQLQSGSSRQLHRLLTQVVVPYKPPAQVQVIVDVDPVTML